MAHDTQVELNFAGFHELLTGSEMRQHLQERGRRVQSAYDGPKGVAATVETDETHESGSWGRDVVRVKATYPGAPAHEAETGDLARALDAGLR